MSSCAAPVSSSINSSAIAAPWRPHRSAEPLNETGRVAQVLEQVLDQHSGVGYGHRDGGLDHEPLEWSPLQDRLKKADVTVVADVGRLLTKPASDATSGLGAGAARQDVVVLLLDEGVPDPLDSHPDRRLDAHHQLGAFEMSRREAASSLPDRMHVLQPDRHLARGARSAGYGGRAWSRTLRDRDGTAPPRCTWHRRSDPSHW